MQKELISLIEFWEGDIWVDGKSIAEAPRDTLLVTPDGRQLVTLSEPGLLPSQVFLEKLRTGCRGTRVNFCHPTLGDLSFAEGDLWSDSFSWFLVFPWKASPADRSAEVEQPLTPSPLEETTDLGPEVKMQLQELWRRDYIESVLGNYDETIHLRQTAAFSDWLNEGTHSLFWLGGELVGHGAWVHDLNSVTHTPCLYWHQWVHAELALDLRRSLHARFFRSLGQVGPPPITGVAAVNRRSISHCARNGMQPLILSVRIPGDYQERL